MAPSIRLFLNKKGAWSKYVQAPMYEYTSKKVSLLRLFDGAAHLDDVGKHTSGGNFGTSTWALNH